LCVILAVDTIKYCKLRFLELAESYTWLNPHLSLRVTWNGEVKIDAMASNPTWSKWLPSWARAAWQSPEDLRPRPEALTLDLDAKRRLGKLERLRVVDPLALA